MSSSRGTAAVRMALLTLLLAAFSTSLLAPVQAGTAAAPEIQDPANDQTLAGPIPGCAPDPIGECAGATRIDIVSVWIDAETPVSINVNILTTGVPGGATAASAQWDFHATFAGTEVVATSTAAGGATVGAPIPGANVAAATVDGNTLILTILKSVYGPSTSGGTLSNLFVVGTSTLPLPAPLNIPVGTDRAPNTGAGQNYTFAGGSGPTVDPNDTDGDGLNDTWEIKYFTNTTAQNASGDPDGDGLTNGQEEALGTDPTKADTDGDGVNDKNDPFPLDPTKGGSNTTTSTSSTTTTTSSSTTSTSRSTTTTSGTSSSDDSINNLDDAIEALKSDLGYLGGSAGGLLAVLVLCILALAVRWSL